MLKILEKLMKSKKPKRSDETKPLSRFGISKEIEAKIKAAELASLTDAPDIDKNS